MWAWLVPVERSVVSKRASYCRVSAGTSLLIRPLCLPRPLPQATDHARQLIEKYVGKPFFDLPYARGEVIIHTPGWGWRGLPLNGVLCPACCSSQPLPCICPLPALPQACGA